ncbi:MAG: hypothetical protein U9R10_01480 [Euryarchaeota archaeon]|nr:hypothetical protein [Euryarchaeota archaeon]
MQSRMIPVLNVPAKHARTKISQIEITCPRMIAKKNRSSVENRRSKRVEMARPSRQLIAMKTNHSSMGV